MYAFVGKLMGMAIRGGHILNLDLPSMLWKPLVGDVVNVSDLRVMVCVCVCVCVVCVCVVVVCCVCCVCV